MVDAIVLLVAVVVIWMLYIGAIVAAARRPDYAYRYINRTKAGTVIMIILTGFIGGSYFLLRIKHQLLAAERAVPPETLPPADAGDVKEWRRTGDPWT
jgi:hypothetical protein